jgi:hypothetical protein
LGLGSGYGFVTASSCTEATYDCIDLVYESYKSFEYEFSSEEDLTCACSSSLIGGRTKVFPCGC